MIIKTLAVLPQRPYAGLGNVLLDRVQTRAGRLGYTRVIHALMRDVPNMRRISGRSARPIRRYVLFGRELGA